MRPREIYMFTYLYVFKSKYRYIGVYIYIQRSQVHEKSMAWQKMFTLLELCVSFLRRGHGNLLCVVPILTDDPRRESISEWPKYG